MKLYRPYLYLYSDDGTNIDWKYLNDYYFESEDDAMDFMAENGYEKGEYNVEEEDFDKDELEDIKIW